MNLGKPSASARHNIAVAFPLHLYVLLIADGHHYKLSASATRAEPHIYKSTIARREYLKQWAFTRTGLRPEPMGLLMFITWVLCFASVASADGLSIPSTWRVRLRYQLFEGKEVLTSAWQAPSFNVSRAARIAKAQAALKLAYADWTPNGLKGDLKWTFAIRRG
jgi:hypothetical protein